jgi:hypothetical protein
MYLIGFVKYAVEDVTQENCLGNIERVSAVLTNKGLNHEMYILRKVRITLLPFIFQ